VRSKKNLDTKDLRQFGLAMAGVLAALGAIHFFKGHTGAYPWFSCFAAVLLAVSVALPGLLSPVYRVFIKTAHAIGWINTRLILAFVYYFILTPIGLIMKIAGNDPLCRKLEPAAESYWVRKEHTAATKETLERQF